MKVRLKGYFSVGGKMIPKGAIYTGDTLMDLPDWVQKEVKGGSPMIGVTETPKAKKPSTLAEAEIKAQKEAKEAKEAKAKEAKEAEEAKEAKEAKGTKPSRLKPRKSGDK